MIECRGLAKAYGCVPAVKDVTVTFAGDAVIMGPSGSGKSSLLRLIAGLEIPDTGTVAIGGTVMSTPERVVPAGDRGIAVAFQSPALWPHMTVEEHLRFAAGPCPEGKEARIRDLLERSGLSSLAGRRPGEISGGEARRVALCRALVAARPVLLLDEPVQNLPGEMRDAMIGLVRDYARRDESQLIWVTHDAAEARCVGAPVWRMEDGRLAAPPENPGGGQYTDPDGDGGGDR
ncbi:hypothetical protein AZH53_10100 [Methanomicrobiaceae archaeon CYW5]|nr:hypothetical protein [Methanovulcanius yangii]